ncbi:hypothetical protein KSS87_004152 [Heliosperma pusillum]|nr:hypothetical protein KSS87_004152 [Heliosperma pusillum]
MEIVEEDDKSKFPETEFPYWNSFRRKFPPDSPFFNSGDIERQLLSKQVALDVSEDEKQQLFVEDRERSILCPIVGCDAQLNSLESFEDHYNARHTASCSVCSRVYPTQRLLSIHVSEMHDSFFQAKVARGFPMYECLVETCGLKFKSYKARHRHLVDKHKFPFSFEFSKKVHQSKKERQKLHRKHVFHKEEASSAMQVENDTMEGLVSENVKAGKLKKSFYKNSCPNVESIVSDAVSKKFRQTFVTAQATLRLFFHDCFVEGCDASIMIVSPNRDAERDAPDNLSLAGDGFDTVIKAKEAVEVVCPGIVSCADILALATRDVVSLTGGPSYKVELGRLDGLVSKASNVQNNLPGPQFDYQKLKAMFSSHKLSDIDMITLSGAHTIGFSHCNRFANRLYNFSPTTPMDPSLDPTYALQLMQECPPTVDPNIVVGIDPDTPRTFDNLYYQNLLNGKGLFTSDETLLSNPKSRRTVEAFASNMSKFSSGFVKSMVKLGRVGVKTSNGEVRRDCTKYNG